MHRDNFPFKLIVGKDIKTTISLVAKDIINIVKHKPNANLGLATGGTAIPVYEFMVDDHKLHKTSYAQVKTFNLDEYINLNPLYIHESYRAYMNFRLFSQVNIKLCNTFFPDHKNPLAYERLIKKYGGLDVQLITLGHNGHIAYNEPNTPITSLTRVVKLTPSTINANARFFEHNPKLVPKTAVSMGIASILKAKKIILLVTGIDKAKALSHVFKNMYDKKWPVTAILQHKNVEIYVDSQTYKLAKGV
ncbi:MAG: glucosamine-6-phosphate deaminase [Mycoplasmataceae bacterium]|jgi:glucosamine-6-phosphate deaminase|nr:glucosamine-6-phosphate deaminase [Mycoplasmataceae bacterium]